MGSRAVRGLRWSESGEECFGYDLGEQETKTPARRYVTLLQYMTLNSSGLSSDTLVVSTQVEER